MLPWFTNIISLESALKIYDRSLYRKAHTNYNTPHISNI